MRIAGQLTRRSARPAPPRAPAIILLGFLTAATGPSPAVPAPAASGREPETAAPEDATSNRGPAEPSPRAAKWSKFEVALAGPRSNGSRGNPNPFRIPVSVEFTDPSGERTITVQAFFDGDGEGGLKGNLWKVRFSPDAVGTWSWVSRSREARLDGQSGSFEVVRKAGKRGLFARRGRLEAVGSPYLRFSEGRFWLKGGADDPEDFLGQALLPTLEDKLQAIDFLAERGINSLYLMTMNVGGDGKNVWPWIGEDEKQARANHERFDVAKLADWETIFTHMQEKGLAIHLVLEDDSGWTGFDRELYYREMVAHFAHHNGLIWNISEEFNENYSPAQIESFARLLRELDPYDHPIAVHHAGGRRALEPLFGTPNFDVASFQTRDLPQNAEAVLWFRRAAEADPRPVISFDETGKLDPSERAKARHIAWSVYLGGANFELHTWPIYEGTYTYEDYGELFADLGRARRFVERRLPFWEMEPRNDLLPRGSKSYLFAKAGEVYAVYTPQVALLNIDLRDAPGAFRVRWFDPAAGELVESDPISGGGIARIGPSPFSGDAVLLLEAIE